jgi:hypothetical protein
MRIKQQLASGSSPVAGGQTALIRASDRNASMRQSALDASCWHRALGVSNRTPLCHVQHDSCVNERLRFAPGVAPHVPLRAGLFHVKQRQRRTRCNGGAGSGRVFAGGGALWVCTIFRGAVEIGPRPGSVGRPPILWRPSPCGARRATRACRGHHPGPSVSDRL